MVPLLVQLWYHSLLNRQQEHSMLSYTRYMLAKRVSQQNTLGEQVAVTCTYHPEICK